MGLDGWMAKRVRAFTRRREDENVLRHETLSDHGQDGAFNVNDARWRNQSCTTRYQLQQAVKAEKKHQLSVKVIATMILASKPATSAIVYYLTNSGVLATIEDSLTYE